MQYNYVIWHPTVWKSYIIQTNVSASQLIVFQEFVLAHIPAATTDDLMVCLSKKYCMPELGLGSSVTTWSMIASCRTFARVYTQACQPWKSLLRFLGSMACWMSRLTCPPTLSTVPSSTPFSFSCSLSSTRSATLLELWLSLKEEECEAISQRGKIVFCNKSLAFLSHYCTCIYGGRPCYLSPLWSRASRWAPAVRRAAGRRPSVGSWSSRTKGHTAAPERTETHTCNVELEVKEMKVRGFCAQVIWPHVLTFTIVSRASWELLITSMVFSQHLVRQNKDIDGTLLRLMHCPCL